jgi:hypothetical protein
VVEVVAGLVVAGIEAGGAAVGDETTGTVVTGWSPRFRASMADTAAATIAAASA